MWPYLNTASADWRRENAVLPFRKIIKVALYPGISAHATYTSAVHGNHWTLHLIICIYAVPLVLKISKMLIPFEKKSMNFYHSKL